MLWGRGIYAFFSMKNSKLCQTNKDELKKLSFFHAPFSENKIFINAPFCIKSYLD